MSNSVTNLSLQNSVLSQFMAEIRGQEVQSDRLRFRRNLERVGEILAYEISKTLAFKRQTIATPLAAADCQVLQAQPVLATILRAGLPLHQGVRFVQENLPPDAHIWCGAIDKELTSRSYIVPGLGDAGDLAYGQKL